MVKRLGDYTLLYDSFHISEIVIRSNRVCSSSSTVKHSLLLLHCHQHMYWLTPLSRTERGNKDLSVRLEENKNDVLNWITEDRTTGAGIYIVCSFFAVKGEWDHQHIDWLTHKTKDWEGEIRTYLWAIRNEFIHLLSAVNVAMRC